METISITNKFNETVEVSENFRNIERGYIAEKLGSWKNTDLERLERHLTDYVETGDPFYLEEFQNQLKWLNDPYSNLQGELRTIEERRIRYQEEQN